jgi:hypothetical protein
MSWRDLLTCKFGVALCLLALLPCRPLCAAEPGISELLTVGWGSQREAREKATKLYQVLLPKKGETPLEHAFGLVLAKHNRYAESISHLELAARKEPSSLEISALKVWVLLVDRKSSEAISELKECIKLLATRRQTDPVAADLWAERLGRCHGFLEGPGAKGVSKNGLESDLPAIHASLAAADKPAYDKGRAAVAREFGRLNAEKTTILTEKEAAEKQKREEEKQKLDVQTERIAGRLDELRNQANDVDERLMAQRNQLDTQVPRVATALNRADRNVDWLAWDAAMVAAEITRLDAAIRAEKDPQKKAVLEARLQGLLAFAAGQNFALGDALDSRSAARWEAYLLQQRQAQVELRAARERAELEAQRTNLLLAQRRAEAKLERLDRPPRSRTPRTAALTGAINSLKTYYQFPFDDERKRLLELDKVK